MAESDKPWVVRDVPERTRRQVKAFAAEQGITMGQAIEFLVDATLLEREPERQSRVMRVLDHYQRAYGQTIDIHTAWRIAAEMYEIERRETEKGQG